VSSLPPADAGDVRRRIALTVLLLALAAAGATDLAFDWPHAPNPLHVVVEATILLACLGGIAWLWGLQTRTRRSLAQARASAESRATERDSWRARAETLLRGLGAAIDDQLRAWQLTPAERETALLLLKGYGHKEIAVLCGRSERTVRQHAVAVYRKSGLGGRAELAAFFLEDLLLPAAPGEADAAAGAVRSEATARQRAESQAPASSKSV
jgi:DNA-binding CsgD family transcriptional regulator